MTIRIMANLPYGELDMMARNERRQYRDAIKWRILAVAADGPVGRPCSLCELIFKLLFIS